MSNLLSTLLAWLLVAIGLGGVAWRTYRKPRTAPAGGYPGDIDPRAHRYQESDLLQPERTSARGSGFGAARAAPSQSRVSESISVVLRRQIPPRDEPPRSWLGGLPMLPDGIEWPRGINPEKRDDGPVPLHFIAQIACADLPPDLWGGLGPRSGWLLFFQNNNTCESEDTGVWRLIHTEELGSICQPPGDIGPIHDGMYTGGRPWTQSHAVYPRWPVDLVKVGNTLRHEGQRSWPTPDEFETVLYPGKPVQRDPARLPALPIFSRHVLRDALAVNIAQLRREVRPQPLSEQVCSQLASPANWDLILSVPTAQQQRAEARFAEAEAQRRGVEAIDPAALERLIAADPARTRSRLQLAELQDLMARHPDAAALIAKRDADRADWLAWRGEVADWLEEWLETLDDSSLDQPLTPADNERLTLLEDAPPQVQWMIDRQGGYAGMAEYQGPRKIEHSAIALLREAAVHPARDAIAEYYLDPARRALLPAELIPQFEAWWRSLHGNRPHRIGGYHDGVQSDAVEGPQDRLLLLQMATDDPIQFCWGDCGAVYAFIRPADLAAGRFDAAEVHLECH